MKDRGFGERESGRQALMITVLAVLLAAAFLISLSIGRFHIPVAAIARRLAGGEFHSAQMEAIFFGVRLPRILLACLIGCSLAAAGAACQGIFQNPLATPDILGASSGAAAGAALALLLRLSGFMVTAFSFIAGLLTIAVVLPLGNRAKGRQMAGLILAGIMLSAIWNAVISFIKITADPHNTLPEITYWLMGSLAKARMQDIGFALPAMAIGILPLLFLRWRINLLTLRDDEAQSMGVRVRLLRTLIILGSTLLTAAAVSVSGVIGWVGLIIPHIIRRFTGNDYRLLMPASMLAGALFLLLIDNVSRNLMPSEIPLGILTSLAGAPFFLWILLKRGELW